MLIVASLRFNSSHKGRQFLRIKVIYLPFHVCYHVFREFVVPRSVTSMLDMMRHWLQKHPAGWFPCLPIRRSSFSLRASLGSVCQALSCSTACQALSCSTVCQALSCSTVCQALSCSTVCQALSCSTVCQALSCSTVCQALSCSTVCQALSCSTVCQALSCSTVCQALSCSTVCQALSCSTVCHVDVYTGHELDRVIHTHIMVHACMHITVRTYWLQTCLYFCCCTAFLRFSTTKDWTDCMYPLPCTRHTLQNGDVCLLPYCTTRSTPISRYRSEYRVQVHAYSYNSAHPSQAMVCEFFVCIRYCMLSNTPMAHWKIRINRIHNTFSIFVMYICNHLHST